MSPNHLIICHPLLLLPSIFPSIRAFSNESVLHIRWPKYWSFSFNINPSNEYSGLIAFRMDWLDLLAVQGTLKSLLQHHSSKASILWRSAFFIVQLSHPYITTGKTIALTRWIFVDTVMSLLFNMLSRLVITFLPKSKHLLISWLQSPSAVIFKPKNKFCHWFHCSPIHLPWSDGTRCHDISFLKLAQILNIYLPTVYLVIHGDSISFNSDFFFIWKLLLLSRELSKTTADGDCSHKIKRPLLLGRKAMTNLDSILKSEDITLPTKVCLVKL